MLAAVIVLEARGIVSVVCSIVLSKGSKPFMRNLTRAATSPSVLGEAAETIWRQVNMVIVKLSLHFTTIVLRSFLFSFKKKLFYLGISNAEGTNKG